MLAEPNAIYIVVCNSPGDSSMNALLKKFRLLLMSLLLPIISCKSSTERDRNEPMQYAYFKKAYSDFFTKVKFTLIPEQHIVITGTASVVEFLTHLKIAYHGKYHISVLRKKEVAIELPSALLFTILDSINKEFTIRVVSVYDYSQPLVQSDGDDSDPKALLAATRQEAAELNAIIAREKKSTERLKQIRELKKLEKNIKSLTELEQRNQVNSPLIEITYKE